ncbi:MAG: YrdB family protein [Ginsengibacter sp.]
MLTILKGINIAAAFLLEIAMLVSFEYFGYEYPENKALKYVLMIALPLLAGVLWGIFAAPKSQQRLPKVQRTLFVLTIFAASVFLLNQTGETALAAVFSICIIINQVLLFIFEE